MSASSSRKKRQEQANAPVTAAPKQKKKLSQGWIFGICICLIIALLVGGILIYRTVKNNRTVLTVGDHDVTVREFNYFYNSTANTLASYASYLNIETGVALDKQYVTENGASYLGLFGMSAACLNGKEPVDGSYDVTWAQVIADNAKDAAVSTYTLYNEAMKAGYEVDDHLQEEIDESMEVMQGYADTNGESLSSLIKRVYGSGCSVSGYRDYVTVRHIAEHYPSSIRYSDEEIAAHLEENRSDFTVATYYSYSVTAASFVEADEEGNKPEPGDAEKQKAEEDAKAMEQNYDVAKATLRADSTRAAVKSTISVEAAAWMFDNAQNGDVKLIKNSDTGTYYVLKLMDKSDYQTLNGLELVISADPEELAEGETPAADKVAAIKASLEADPSEENFRALMEEYGAEPHDLENLTRTSVSSVSNDVLAWYLDGVDAGKWTVAESNGSTIFLYCTGLGDLYSRTVVNNKLLNEWAEQLIADASAACGYDEAAAMSANVGLVFSGN